MSFPPSVKTAVLTRCQRICTLCHRRVGVRMEAHHIVAAADGGADTEDNAIGLCFDCHAEVGHYNPRHPKGNRYSPAELRARRDDLYRRLAEGLGPMAVDHRGETPGLLAGELTAIHVGLGASLQGWQGKDKISLLLRNEGFDPVMLTSCEGCWLIPETEFAGTLKPDSLSWIVHQPRSDGLDSFVIPRLIPSGITNRLTFIRDAADAELAGVDPRCFPIEEAPNRLAADYIRYIFEFSFAPRSGTTRTARVEYHHRFDSKSKGWLKTIR